MGPQLGERIHELEDELESRIATIQELEGELNASDAAFEESQLVHDQVVASLKEVCLFSSLSFLVQPLDVEVEL